MVRYIFCLDFCLQFGRFKIRIDVIQKGVRRKSGKRVDMLIAPDT